MNSARGVSVRAISVRGLARAAALSLVAVMLGCAHPTPYQPESASSAIAGGYSDERLAEGRYRVKFSGNSLTSRETVEAYLLYRAAELTVQQGYDWFAIIDREMDHKVTREIRRDPFYRPWYGPEYGAWLPYWRYYMPGRGWYAWDPYHADPFWADGIDERRVEEFEATADIRLGRGTRPSADDRAYDARKVLEEIGPRVDRHPPASK
ncbi:hypothetical protein EKN06_05395 [Croceicoccus ponticola]|uniref:DUF4136 domain-containing protein n=1 Tax=Croceicoccus ponticola TaxID=2217664 RepID=A0A437H1T8_9SPHN|nr:hypothetical protein [Croceicoccus ponticola]RVQ69598.1 hypothetical protein EKN06_05395 [Croceicoccus ponticola]